MPDVEEQARPALDADAAWRGVGDFGAVGDWHPMLARVDGGGNTPRSRRIAHAADGGTQVERLDAWDAAGGARWRRSRRWSPRLRC